jgi:hypothetical protein
MAPTYKPLSFTMPQFEQPVDFFTAEQAYAKQRATEIAQEAAQADAEIKVRKAEADEKLRGALTEQFGASGEYDPDTAFNIAKKFAAESGDLESMINIEKAQRERSATRAPLTAQQRSFYEPILERPIPEGTTMQDLTTAGALQRANAYGAQTDFNINSVNTDLRRRKLEQEVNGTRTRAPNTQETGMVGASDAATNLLDNISARYLPEIPENRGIRYAEAKANPNSAISRYVKDLSLAAKQVALSMEVRVTDQDYQIIADAAIPNDLDTMDTLIDKNQRLKDLVENRTRTNFNAMEGGGVNVTGLRNRKRVDFEGNDITGALNRGTGDSVPLRNPANNLPGGSSQGGTTQTKTVGGITYQKVNGGWLPQ